MVTYKYELHERVFFDGKEGKIASRIVDERGFPRYTIEFDGGGWAKAVEGQIRPICEDVSAETKVIFFPSIDMSNMSVSAETVKPLLAGIRVDSIVSEATAIVRGNREGTYGSPTKNFETTAAMLQAWLNARPDRVVDGKVQVSALDIADIMIILKLARLGNNPTHRDSRVDIVGYTDCADMIMQHQGVA